VKRLISSVTFVALVASGVAIASAQIAGSDVNGTITQSLSSNSAYVGEPVLLRYVTSADGSGRVSGGKLYGKVTEVVRAGQGRPGKIGMYFSTLILPSGEQLTVSGRPTAMQANTKNNAGKEAAGAVVGMLVGNMIGKTIFHTDIGGAAGAGGGFLLAKNNRQNITIPSNSVVTVHLASVRRQSH
jgi:hypothetical protein